MTPAERAARAIALLRVDPSLGGLWLRDRAGPVRQAFEDRFTGAIPLPGRRISPDAPDEALFGGLDLSATLSEGRMVRAKGALAQPCALILPMAERTAPARAARLGQELDDSAGHVVLALDEGANPDELLPPALAERLAFAVDLEGTRAADLPEMPPAPTPIKPHQIKYKSELLTQIARISLQFGIDSLRAPQFTLAATRANAALSGRKSVESEDIEVAVALTLAHRATQLPDSTDQAEAEPPEPDQDPDEGKADNITIPDEVILDAIRAALPPDLLARLHAKASPRGQGSGAGAAKKGNRRGRPLPSRRGRLDKGRLDLVATLRAAAPWQTLRKRGVPAGTGIQVRPEDIHIRRFEEHSDRVLIFAVDASGSAAFARMAEAKGAVELMLAEAYARRDHVALTAFRGEGAEVLLPPTRSLVQTKSRLASLPGGGGTPLAAGLMAALEMGLTAKGKGMSPVIVLLTDGRPNIALDAAANRAKAAEDATKAARAIRAQGVDALVVDCGKRPEPSLRTLAQAMDAPYIPLPRADARGLSQAVGAALDAG